jgi:hypothetical protein
MQIKMGDRIARHALQIVFQLAEVAASREQFAAILERINQLRLASWLVRLQWKDTEVTG